MGKVITVEEGGFVDIEDFKDIVDVDRVEYYSIKALKDKSLIIKFYDKKKKIVKPYGSK